MISITSITMFSGNTIMSFRLRWFFFPQQLNFQVNFTSVIWFQFVRIFFLQWKRKKPHFSCQTYHWHIYCIIVDYYSGFSCYTPAQKWWIGLLLICFEAKMLPLPSLCNKTCAKLSSKHVWIYLFYLTSKVYIWTCTYMHNNQIIRLIQ